MRNASDQQGEKKNRNTNNKIFGAYIQQFLHKKVCKGDVTRDDSQHGVAMLEQCCNSSKQCRNAVLR